MTTLTVKLPEHVRRKLDAEARRRKTTKSAVLVEAFERTQRSDNGRASLYDKLKHLIVADPKAPRDLSTNPKYMKGYGRSRTR